MSRAAFLAFIAGWVDAAAWLATHVFVANQTGNLLQAGIDLASGRWREAALRGVCIAGFLTGVLLVSLNGDRPGPSLMASGLAIAGSAFLRPGAASLLLQSLALGGQSAAVRTFGGVGINTAFITGDLQKFGAAIAARVRGGRHEQDAAILLAPAVLAAYALGGLAGLLASHNLAHPAWPAGLLLPCALLLP